MAAAASRAACFLITLLLAGTQAGNDLAKRATGSVCSPLRNGAHLFSSSHTCWCDRGYVCTMPLSAGNPYWIAQFFKWSSNDLSVLVEATPLEGQAAFDAAVVTDLQTE